MESKTNEELWESLRACEKALEDHKLEEEAFQKEHGPDAFITGADHIVRLKQWAEDELISRGQLPRREWKLSPEESLKRALEKYREKNNN